MKQFVLWTLGISVVSLAIGLGITAYSGFKLEEQTIDLTKSASVDEINSIKIQSSSADIVVASTTEKEVTIRYYGIMRSSGKQTPTVEIAKAGKDLNIKSGMPLGFMWYSTANFDDFKLEVNIPSTYKQKLEIKSDFGDIETSSLALEKLAITTGSKGTIKISDCQGEQEINSALGNVTITDKNLSANKTISSTSGDIKLFLPQQSDFSYIFDTTSGTLVDNFSGTNQQGSKEHFTGKVGNGFNNISAKSNSGNLTLNKNN